MAKVKNSNTQRRMRPALTPEARENQLVALAVDLAEKQLREGTASSQVITHYLKMGSQTERLKREQMEEENELLKAKTKAIKESGDRAVAYEEVMNAMRSYSGKDDNE